MVRNSGGSADAAVDRRALRLCTDDERAFFDDVP